MRYIAAFVLGAIFTVGWMQWQSVDNKNTPAVKSAQHQLTEDDFKEYLRLKDDKEKLAKAEEIFSKIIVLMLYDIGVKISQPVQDAFLKPTAELPLASSTSSIRSKTVDTMAVNKVAVLPQANVPVAANPSKPAEEVSDTSEAEKFVEAQQLDPSKIPATNFRQANAESLQALEGQFTGFIRPADGSAEIRVEIDLNIQERRNPPTGVYSLRLYRGTELFSNSRGRGGLSNFQSSGEVPSIWIEEGGRDYRFQVFYFSRLQIWKANAYKKDKSGQWHFYSRFDLNKQ